MSQDDGKPQSIAALLDADPKTLSSWSEEVSLVAPEQMAHEEAMARA